MSLTRRAPCFFCCSSSSSTWPAFSNPSSTSASAMRSPNDFIVAMALTEGLAEVGQQISGRRQIPDQPVRGGPGQLLDRLLIERIRGRDQDRLAHPVKRQHTPALTDARGKSPG